MRGGILLVEDHAIIAQAIVATLREAGFEPVHMVPVSQLSDEGILNAEERFQPAVVLLDLSLGRDRSSFNLIAPLAQRGARVVAFTAETDRTRHAECLEAGAVGVLLKEEPVESIVERLGDVLAGRSIITTAAAEEMRILLREDRAAAQERLRPFRSLTPQERTVLGSLLAGRSPSQIAEEQGVSVRTVRTQLQNVYRKLGVSSQLGAVTLARSVGWNPE